MKSKRSKRPSSSANAASLVPHNVLQTNLSLAEATEHISRLGVTEVDTNSNSKTRTPWVEEGLQCIRYLWKKDANTRQKKLLELKNVILSVDSGEGRSASKSRELVEAFSRVVERLLLWEREPRIRINSLEVIDVMFEKFRDGTTPFLDKVVPALLAIRADLQRDVARKAKHIYFSHFNTDAKRKKLISHLAGSIGNFFKQNCKDVAECRGKDKNVSNQAVHLAISCLYSALEDLEAGNLEGFPFEDVLEKLLDLKLLQSLLELSRNAEWKLVLFDLVIVCLRLAERMPSSQFAVQITSVSFIHAVLLALLNESFEPLIRKSVIVMHCLLQVHFKKYILGSTEVNDIVNWVLRRVLNSNETLLIFTRELFAFFEDLFKVVDENNAERLLEGTEVRLTECLNTSTNWQQKELASSLIGLYLDCIFFRVKNWQVSTDSRILDQHLFRHLKTFWDQMLFCKVPSQVVLSDLVLKQMCKLGCNSYIRENFKSSLSSSIMDSLLSIEEDRVLDMEKIERIGIFLYHNCPGAGTVIPDTFQEFFKKNLEGTIRLKLGMLKLFCILNDSTYVDFLETQLELFASNTIVSEEKELSCMLLSCIEHYISSTDSNAVEFQCPKFIYYCSSNFFSRVFVLLRSILSSSSISTLVKDIQFQMKVFSTLREICTTRSLAGQEERVFLDSFVTVWMEHNCPLSDTQLLLHELLKSIEVFKSDLELVRKCLLLLVTNASEEHDVVKMWVSIVFNYLPILKDWFFEYVWDKVETCWSMNAKLIFHEQLCLKLRTLVETISCSEDVKEYAILYHSSFFSFQGAVNISENVSQFLGDMEKALCEDGRTESSVTLTFIGNLMTSELLKIFSCVGVERLGVFLGLVLLHVENDAETYTELIHSVKQYLKSLSCDELEDTVFHVFLSACERLKDSIECMEPLHSLQEILALTMEILSSAPDKNGRKLSYGLVESKKFLSDDFSFFVLFHMSSLNIEKYPSKLLQMTLQSLLNELVSLYNSDDQSSVLVHTDKQSSKARLRAILLCKKIFLSNRQVLGTKWAQFAFDIVRGLKKVEMYRNQQSQHENTLSNFVWGEEELDYIFHTMDGLFLFALRQDGELHDADLVAFIKSIAEGALEEMHYLLLANENSDVDYFPVSCAACSLLLELETCKCSVPEMPPHCDTQLLDKFYFFALDILLHVVIHKPMLQMEPGIVSIAKLARKYSLLKSNDVSLSLKCYKLLGSLNQEVRSTGYTLLVGLNPGYLITDVCHSEEETITWFHEEVEKLLAFPLNIDWFEELDQVLKSPVVSSEFLGSQTCVVVGYILTWTLFLNYKSQGDPEFSRILSEYLREHFQLFDDFVTFIAELSIFRMNDLSKELQNIVVDSACASCRENFLDMSELPVKPFYDIHILLHSCSKVFGFCLAHLPALTRRWYNDSLSNDKRVKVEGFVRRHIAPSIIETEFSLLQLSFEAFQGNVGSLQVKPVNVTREIIAVYSFTDTRIEIVLKLPEDFPLSLVNVEKKTAIGMPEAKWRKTVLAISSLLAMKDGNLRDAIDLWRRNLDRQFEGVEECPICFSILHISNGTLPRLECVTCKHKFHAACLYKWLQSSATSSCPLCRTVGRFFK